MKTININKSYVKLSVDDMDENELVIDMVWVDPAARGQGIGKELVRLAIDYADSQNKGLGLYAEPQDDDGTNGLSTDALIEFYRGLGFESDSDCDQLMKY